MTMYSKQPRERIQSHKLQLICGEKWSLWALVVAGLLMHQAPLCGQEYGTGALLLKETDRVISGKISQRGEFYEVEIAPESRVSIPKQNVAHVATSLEGLYQAKRLGVSKWSVGDHYQLTRWCLLNNLLAHAAEHYAETVQRSPNHPRIRQLGVELQQRMLQDPDFRQYLGLAATEPKSLESQTTVNVPAALSVDVVAASTFETQSSPPPAVGRHFAERIQPILLNRCSQAACHGAQSHNSFRIVAPYATAAARITGENLASALKQVSTQSNQASPLVHFATQAHGIQPAPAIAMSETKLIQELESWIAFVHNPVVSAVASDSNSLGSQVKTAEQFQVEPFASAVMLIPVDPGATQLKQVPRSSATTADVSPETPFPSSAFPVGSLLPTAADMDALDAQIKAALGERSPTSNAVPVDPFDPAEFNRKVK